MAIFFFHIRDGALLIPDDEGLECFSLAAVHREGSLSAGDLITAHIREGTFPHGKAIEITDEHGSAIASMAARMQLH